MKKEACATFHISTYVKMREKNGSYDCIWHELIFRHSADIFSLKNASRK